jgi:filamentous hemagglutinin
VSPQEVLGFQKQIGFPIRRAGAMDQGVPGQYFASHAERQAALLKPNAPIEVSSPMCSDCQAFFQRLAEYSGVEQQVTDPLGTHFFSP